MQSILNDAPPPTTEHGAGDAALWRVIARGLEKDPDARWESMTELGEALALWLYEHGVKEDISGNSVRALWLDGMLSGVKAEVDTEAPPPGASESEAPISSRSTDITTPVGSPLWLRMRQWRRQLARRWRPMAVATAGMLGGVAVTLLVGREPGEAVKPEAGRQEPVAAPVEPVPDSSKPAATLPNSPEERGVVESLPRQSGGALKSTSDDVARPAETRAASKEPIKRKPQVRRRSTTTTKSINDFGF
jgi:hypothetical protein